MGFLNEVLERPKNERPVMLLVVGYPADEVRVPARAMEKKSLDQIATWCSLEPTQSKPSCSA